MLGALVQAGYKPLIPFGGGGPYDIAVDDGAKFLRVQCKTGRLIRGAVVFLLPGQRTGVFRAGC